MRVQILRIVLGGTALALILFGAYAVLSPFVRPVLWALILCSATWSSYDRLQRRLGGRRSLASLLMTLALAVVVVVPAFLLGLALVDEVQPVVARLRVWGSAETLTLPVWVERAPWFASQLHQLLASAREEWLGRALGVAQPILHLGRNVLGVVVELFLTLFTLFFVYPTARVLAEEARLLLRRVAGERGPELLAGVRATVRAVIYGWLLTAAGQGLVAMVGFWIVGLDAPVLLGVATGVAALVPFGVGLVWLPVIGWLAIQGVWWKVVFMASWSLLVVSLIDNILRPLFISGPTKIPFIIVFFGVLGGLVAYGLLGLVLGPVLLAVLLALWREAHDTLTAQSDAGRAAVASPAPAE